MNKAATQQTQSAPAVEQSPLDAALEQSEILQLAAGRRVKYVAQGETEPIEMSVALVRKFLTKPTKRGAHPTEADVMKFIMLCKARQLNPWVSDAYLVGYDGNDGPEFSLLTSVHALHKRAERCPEYDGLEAGVVVRIGDTVQELAGTCYPDDAVLLGGWAKVYRKDRSRPYYVSLRLASYDKGMSLWKSNKPGMIRKCAIAGAIREAFPNQTSGLYLREEMDQRERTLEAAGLSTPTADTTPIRRVLRGPESEPKPESPVEAAAPTSEPPVIDLDKLREKLAACNEIRPLREIAQSWIDATAFESNVPQLDDELLAAVDAAVEERAEQIRAGRGKGESR